MKLKLALTTLILSTGCVTSGTNMDSIRVRHAAEYDCDEAQVEVKELEWAVNRARGTYSAKGCAQRAIYVCDMGSCIRNSESRKN